jgi:hypothetical protein
LPFDISFLNVSFDISSLHCTISLFEVLSITLLDEVSNVPLPCFEKVKVRGLFRVWFGGSSPDFHI